MVKQSPVETQFRERLQQERERRKWSRADLSKLLQDKGFEHIYPSTIAKIEYGERAVRIDEATAIADLFEVSVDALLGRKTAVENDLAYTLRGVLDVAQQCSMQVSVIQNTLSQRFVELQALDFEGQDELMAEADAAGRALRMASEALGRIGAFRMAALAGITVQFGRSDAMYNSAIRQMLSQMARPEGDDDEA
jgi:transcriptional regulator with XRE-family HTH domain